VFVGHWPLEGGELAVEKRGRHKVPLPRSEPAGEQVVIAIEVHERHTGSGSAEPVTIPASERRACHHGPTAVGKPRADLGGEPVEPGPAVGVGQGCASPHFLDVGCGMEIVAVEKVAAQAGGEQPADGRLSAPAHAHHHDDRLHNNPPRGGTLPDMKPSHHMLVAIAFLMASAVPSSADHWPQWRGPRNDGTSTETGIPAGWSKTKHVAWRTPLPGRAGATPCVWGDRIYLTSNEGSDLVLLCVNARDGSILWKKTVGSGNQDARAGEGNSASPSPCTDGEHVWVFFGTGILACYTTDGAEVWKTDVNDRFGKIDIQFGMTSTPVLDGDALYLQLIHGAMKLDDDTRTGKVIRLDKKTGKTVWEVDRVTNAQFECKHSYASPFFYRHDGREFLVVHGADCITGHALADGKELWRFGGLNGPTDVNPKPHDQTFRCVASPCCAPGVIIVPTCKGGPTIALRVTDDLAGDCTGKKAVVKWINPLTPDVSIPLVADGLVYMLHKDGRLQCVDLETGKDVYLERTHTGQHRTSPLLADGRLYYGSNDGWVTIVKAGRTFEQLDTIDFGGEAITASLVVSDGTLYVRSYDALYAIKSK
jgi:outer membrane protein assembly factor BamB